MIEYEVWDCREAASISKEGKNKIKMGKMWRYKRHGYARRERFVSDGVVGSKEGGNI